jgi:hypothetical protein
MASTSGWIPLGVMSGVPVMNSWLRFEFHRVAALNRENERGDTEADQDDPRSDATDLQCLFHPGHLP